MVKRKLAIVGWLIIGALLGWAALVHLWQAGYVKYVNYDLRIFLVVIGCMILAAVYGGRNHVELLPRLVAYPLLFSGLAWMLRPEWGGCGESYWYMYDVLTINFFYPILFIPAGVIGGIIAIVFTRLRRKDEPTIPC